MANIVERLEKYTNEPRAVVVRDWMDAATEAKGEIERQRAELAALREQEPVAWRVSEYPDGWALFKDHQYAKYYRDATGASMQPLYAAPVPAVTVKPDAIAALTNDQRQLDVDGCEVGVSRQALDELLAALASHAGNTKPAVSIERVGRALWEEIVDEETFDEAKAANNKPYQWIMEQARIAISAMQDPTPEERGNVDFR